MQESYVNNSEKFRNRIRILLHEIPLKTWPFSRKNKLSGFSQRFLLSKGFSLQNGGTFSFALHVDKRELFPEQSITKLLHDNVSNCILKIIVYLQLKLSSFGQPSLQLFHFREKIFFHCMRTKGISPRNTQETKP